MQRDICIDIECQRWPLSIFYLNHFLSTARWSDFRSMLMYFSSDIQKIFFSSQSFAQKMRLELQSTSPFTSTTFFSARISTSKEILETRDCYFLFSGGFAIVARPVAQQVRVHRWRRRLPGWATNQHEVFEIYWPLKKYSCQPKGYISEGESTLDTQLNLPHYKWLQSEKLCHNLQWWDSTKTE